MAESSNRGAIIAALIGAIAIIIGALIEWHPWTGDPKVSFKKNPFYLSGTVVDEKSNESISQAEITLVGRNEHYYTEGNGNFHILVRDDSVNNVRIRVTKMNYVPYDMTYDLPNESVVIPLAKEK